MPFYVTDYLGDTMHLNTVQHGAYLLMLLACWKNGGTLPDDEQELANICKLTQAEWIKHARVLRRFFKEADGQLGHTRVLAELAKAQELSAKRSAVGKRGGRPPKPDPEDDLDETNSFPNGKQNETNSFPIGEAKPKQNETPSPSPITNVITKDTNYPSLANVVGAACGPEMSHGTDADPPAPPDAPPDAPPQPPPGPPPDAPPADAADAAHPPPKRAQRLPEGWKLPQAWGQWALTEYPAWTPEVVRTEAERFADHWHAKAGKDGVKLDWQATWRNWCRSDIAQRSHKPTRAEQTAAAPALQSFRERDAQHAKKLWEQVSGIARRPAHNVIDITPKTTQETAQLGLQK